MEERQEREKNMERENIDKEKEGGGKEKEVRKGKAALNIRKCPFNKIL